MLIRSKPMTGPKNMNPEEYYAVVVHKFREGA